MKEPARKSAQRSPFMATKELPATTTTEQPNSKLQLVTRPDGKQTRYKATSRIEPGEIILIDDSPLLLYPSALDSVFQFCSSCFRVLPAERLYVCQTCKKACFCSAQCHLKSHPATLCQALPSLIHDATCPRELLFLLAVYPLISPENENLAQLRSLPARSTNIDHIFVDCLLSKIEALSNLGLSIQYSKETIAELLSIERANSIPFYDPKNLRIDANSGQGGVRAYGFWLKACQFEHNCMPNACFFRCIDDPQELRNNTSLICRATHEIKKSHEVSVTYVPLRTNYLERKTKLMENFGYECNCGRCRIESQAAMEVEAIDVKMTGKLQDPWDYELQKENAQVVVSEWKPLPSIISDYMYRFMCDCEFGGCLAPLPPSDVRAAMYSMECNMCGKMIGN